MKEGQLALEWTLFQNGAFQLSRGLLLNRGGQTAAMAVRPGGSRQVPRESNCILEDSNGCGGDLRQERVRTLGCGLLRKGKTAQNVRQNLQHRVWGGPGKVRDIEIGNKLANLE